MGELKEYDVDTGNGITTTMLLNEDDAEKLGDKASPASKKATPANKARSAQDK